MRLSGTDSFSSMSSSSNKPFDQNAEIRAMILTALPFPPLPIKAWTLEENSSQLDHQTAITSHDIISHLLELACNDPDKTIHEPRQKRQQLVLRGFLEEVMALENVDEIPPPKMYEIYCKHTARHVETFFLEGRVPPIEFLPMHVVERKDPVHTQMCDYMAGQAVLLGIEPSTAKAFAGINYPYLLLEAKKRLFQEPTN